MWQMLDHNPIFNSTTHRTERAGRTGGQTDEIDWGAYVRNPLYRTSRIDTQRDGYGEGPASIGRSGYYRFICMLSFEM